MIKEQLRPLHAISMAPSGLVAGCHRSASSSSLLLSCNLRWRPYFFSCSPSLYTDSSYRFQRGHWGKRLRISSRNLEPPQLVRVSQKAQQLQNDENFVEVIAIGSRKDAVLDFCLNSPFQSNSLRFWYCLFLQFGLWYVNVQELCFDP